MSRRRHALPGFSLSLGVTLGCLSLIVLLPLGAAFVRTAALPWEQFARTAWSERAQAAYLLTFGASLAAASANAVIGLLLAWVLVPGPTALRLAGRPAVRAADGGRGQ